MPRAFQVGRGSAPPGATVRALRALLAPAAAAGLLAFLGSGCGSSGGGSGMPPVDPPPDVQIEGEYQVTLELAADTCRSAADAVTVAMRVEEMNASTAIVDIPVEGSPEPVCNPGLWIREGNVLTRTRSSQSEIGGCTVQTDLESVLEFSEGGLVIGSEIERRTAIDEDDPDCSGLGLPCERELTVEGAECVACYECVEAIVP